MRVQAPARSPLASTVALSWYFCWLLQPDRVGNPVLFARARRRRAVQRRPGARVLVDVPRPRPPPAASRRREPGAIARAHGRRASSRRTTSRSTSSSRPSPRPSRLRGAKVRVALLDDGEPRRDGAPRRPPRRALRPPHRPQRRQGRQHQPRPRAHDAGASSLVLDCDHVPRPDVPRATRCPTFARPVRRVRADAAVLRQRRRQRRVAAAAWSQQALFFGPIARGKDAHGAMFCCGTNVVFRRTALEAVGGFPEGSLTEDFELSVASARAGLVVGVRARGARLRTRPRGPRLVRQPAAPLGAGLHRRDPAGAARRRCRGGRRRSTCCRRRYFLTGLDRARLPVAAGRSASPPALSRSPARPPTASSPHFAPYFGLVARHGRRVGTGTYTFAAYSLADVDVLDPRPRHAARRSSATRPLRRDTEARRRPAASGDRSAPTLVVVAVLVAVAAYGLTRDRSPATLNNVAFAALHIVGALRTGVAAASCRRWPRPRRSRAPSARRRRP